MQQFNRVRVGFLVSAAMLVAGCAAPQALTRSELVDGSKALMARSEEGRAALPAEWTVEHAIVHALQHNVQFRIAALESAIATGNHKLAKMDMLPGLVASAGYTTRNNTMASISEDVATGGVSLVPSTSSERSASNARLYFNWDMIDFGLAYLRSREFGEQALIADENRRRVVQSEIRDVVYAWWQAQAYQQLQPDLVQLRADVDGALKQSDEIVRQRLGNALQAVEYRSALLLVLRRIDSVSLQLDQSRDDLVRQLHLPAGYELHVAPAPAGAGSDTPALPDIDPRYWQYGALVNRPEMRQARYDARNAEIASKRRYLEMLPRLIFSFGTHYDSNSYLVNNRWESGSAEMSWNLMKLASVPGVRRDARMNRELSQLREEAQAAAVLSQVAIAGKAYDRNRHTWCLSKSLLELNQRKAELLGARSAAASIDQLTLVRARLDNLLLRTESALQFAEYQRARMTVLLSVGAMDMPAIDDPAAAEKTIANWLASGIDTATLAELRRTGADFNLPALPDDATIQASAAQACVQ